MVTSDGRDGVHRRVPGHVDLMHERIDGRIGR